jgi:hypothetical protein
MLDSAIHAGHSLQVEFSPPPCSLGFEVQSHSHHWKGKKQCEFEYVKNTSRQAGNTGTWMNTEESRADREFQRDQSDLYAGGAVLREDNAEPQAQQMQITVVVRRPHFLFLGLDSPESNRNCSRNVPSLQFKIFLSFLFVEKCFPFSSLLSLLPLFPCFSGECLHQISFCSYAALYTFHES